MILQMEQGSAPWRATDSRPGKRVSINRFHLFAQSVMKLKYKILASLCLFASLPIMIFGIYEAIQTYRMEVTSNQQQIATGLKRLQNDLGRILGEAESDLEYLTKTEEVIRMMEGVEMEDVDEIAYWSEGLKTALSNFVRHRRSFHSIYFIGPEGKALVQTHLLENEQTPEPSTELPVAVTSVSESNPNGAFWVKQQKDMELWLRFKPSDSEVDAFLVAKVNLNPFFAASSDQELYVTGMLGGYEMDLVHGGKPATGTRPQMLRELDKSQDSWQKTVGSNLLGFRKFHPFRHAASDELHLVQARPKTVLTAPIIKRSLSMTAICLGAIVLAVIAGNFLGNSITKPIHHSISESSTSAYQMTQAIDLFSGNVSKIAKGTTDQAAAIEETSASLEEISAMSKDNTARVQSAKQLAIDTHSVAETGSMDVVEMDQAMNSIKESSQDISRIINTIDEVAFQTNLLALNAAVEAARAGESGAGFAVVADEVRELAKRSAIAAKQTSDIIRNSVKRIEKGVEISGKLSDSLKEIVKQSTQVDTIVAEMAVAANEQDLGIQQIKSAIQQIDLVTHSNVSDTNECQESVQTLCSQAEFLESVMQQLAIIVDGGKNSTNQEEEDKPLLQTMQKPTN